MLLTGATAPAGGTCGVTNPKPCWRRRGGKGFRYRDIPQSILPGGINRVSLKAGRDGKAEVQVHASGGLFEFPSNGGLGLPDLAAIQQPLRIQVQNSSGLCFEAAFSAPPDRQDRRLARLEHVRAGAPLLLVAFAAITLLAGLVLQLYGRSYTVLRSMAVLGLLVSLLHYWYDGFVWSVRRREV